MRKTFHQSDLQSDRDQGKPETLREIQDIRKSILNRVLIAAVVFSTLTLLAAVPARLEGGEGFISMVFGLYYSGLVIIALGRKIPYHIRTTCFLVLIALTSLTSFYSDGLSGIGQYMLLCIPFLTAIFGGFRFGFISLLFSWALYAGVGFPSNDNSVFGFFFSQDTLGAATGTFPVDSMFFFLVSMVIYISTASLLKGLEELTRKKLELVEDLAAERAHLESRVQLRAQDLERRLEQSQIANAIILKFNGYLDDGELASDVPEIISQRLNIERIGYFGISNDGSHAYLKSISGAEINSALVDSSIQNENRSLIGWCVKNQKARIALDINRDWTLLDHSLVPEAKSELVVPVRLNRIENPISQIREENITNTCLGVLAFYSTQPMAYTSDDLLLYQSIADNLGVAIENARVIKRLHEALIETSNIKHQSFQESWKKINKSEGTISYTAQRESNVVDRGKPSLQLPVLLRNQVIGLVSIDNQPKNNPIDSPSDEDRAFIETVIREAAFALENARLIEEAQMRVTNERLLSELEQKTHKARDIDEILRIAVKEIGLGMDASEAFIRIEKSIETR